MSKPPNIQQLQVIFLSKDWDSALFSDDFPCKMMDIVRDCALTCHGINRWHPNRGVVVLFGWIVNDTMSKRSKVCWFGVLELETVTWLWLATIDFYSSWYTDNTYICSLFIYIYTLYIYIHYIYTHRFYSMCPILPPAQVLKGCNSWMIWVQDRSVPAHRGHRGHRS